MMLGKLEAVILPLIRQPEQTDTHQYIRQHERDSKKKNGQSSQQNADDQNEDQAAVSIESIILFLENMLAKQTNAGSSENIAIKSDTALNAQSQNHTKPSLYAANAYAHAAKTSPIPQETIEHKIPPHSDSPDNSIIEHIYEELLDLKKSGILELEIKRADTFLNSLLNAIDSAKTGVQ